MTPEDIRERQSLSEERKRYVETSQGTPFRPRGFYWFAFSSWHAGSNLSRLPVGLRQLGMLIRNWRVFWRPRRLEFHHLSDGMGVKVLMPFMNDDVFKKSYERMILASGSPNDPGIQHRIHQALWAASVCKNVEGDFVECGSARGLVFSAVLESLPEWPTMTKHVWLFDTFSPHMLNEKTGDNDPSQAKHSRYAVDVEHTAKNFSEWDRVHLVAGRLPETLAGANLKSIALLHIDLNFPETEKQVLRTLWPLVSKGGIVLLDDYGSNEAQNSAMREVAKELGFEILSTGNTAGIIVKS